MVTYEDADCPGAAQRLDLHQEIRVLSGLPPLVPGSHEWNYAYRIAARSKVES
jgi:hypothetical protein